MVLYSTTIMKAHHLQEPLRFQSVIQKYLCQTNCTPDALHRAIGGYKKAKYSVSVDKNSNFYSWQYDNETVTSPEGKKQDGYAGTYGKPIDGLYLSIV